MAFFYFPGKEGIVLRVRIEKEMMNCLMVCLLVALLLLSAGCGGTSDQKAAAPSAKTDSSLMTIADTTGDWGLPNPYNHYLRGPGYIRMTLVFDTLVWKNETGYGPGLAKTWEWLPGEKAWRMTLQKDAKWHDGVAFTARDVVFSFVYYKKHPYPYIATPQVIRAEAVDDATVKIFLTEPYAPFLDYIAASVPILPEHIWKDVVDPKGFTGPAAVVGSGPYRLAEYSKEHGTYRFTAVPGYYLGEARVKELRFVKLSWDMSVAALKRGEVDAAQVPPDMAEPLKKEGYKLISQEGDWVAILLLNHRQAPLNQVEVRQALAYLIDRPELVKTTLRGHGVAGSPGLAPPGSPWTNPQVLGKYSYDPAQAANLLKQAGYIKQNGQWIKDGQPLKLELLVGAGGLAMSGAPSERQGEFIKNQLAKEGIVVDLRVMDPKTVDSRQNSWQFQLALTGSGGLGCDPEAFSRLLTREIFFGARWQGDADWQQAVGKSRSEMDPALRRNWVYRIQELAARDMPFLPLYYPRSYWAFNDKVRLWYTFQGVGNGAPIPQNKLIFVQGK